MHSVALQECLRRLERDETRLIDIDGDLPVNQAFYQGLIEYQIYRGHVKTLTEASVLPRGTRITAAHHYGECNVWFVTGHIHAVSEHGLLQEYFVKYGAGSIAHDILAGEFSAAQTLYSIIPTSTPRPIGWGSLGAERADDGWFILFEFIHFTDDRLCEESKLANLLVRLHQPSKGPSTLFGTSVPVHDGVFCHVDGWETTWTALFSKMLSRAHHYDLLTNGVCHELDAVFVDVQRIIIPRLIGKLESNGRTIPRCFIHGDLWEGNVRVQKNTGNLFIFDSNGYYAHNEMELAYCETKHHLMHKQDYRAAYHALRDPTEPACEAGDRIRLYSLKPYLMYSAHARNHVSRMHALETMRYLVAKYGDGVPTPAEKAIEIPVNKDVMHSAETLGIIDIVTAETT